MTKGDYRDRQVAVLRDRLARLSQASLRINESLDLDTVLQEVVDSARSLTGAHYGGITTLDESGRLQDVVTSGLTPEAHQALLDLPAEGLGLFQFLSTHPEPLRLRDFSAHAKSRGLTHDFMQVGAFLGTPIGHRGTPVGHFYLAEKEDGRAFTDEDEETLGLFAAQATLRKQADPDRAEPDQPYVLGDVTINYEERRVSMAGRRVRLTAKEYQLLYELSVGRGRVLTHDVLLRRIWGLYSAVDSRLVRTLVKRLRRTLGDDANDPRYIFTEPGVGYRIGTVEEREEGSSEA